MSRLSADPACTAIDIDGNHPVSGYGEVLPQLRETALHDIEIGMDIFLQIFDTKEGLSNTFTLVRR